MARTDFEHAGTEHAGTGNTGTGNTGVKGRGNETFDGVLALVLGGLTATVDGWLLTVVWQGDRVQTATARRARRAEDGSGRAVVPGRRRAAVPGRHSRPGTIGRPRLCAVRR